MKKKIMFLALMCTMTVGANAQIYSYDRGMQMPTSDLYDTDIMSMAIRAAAETAQRRKEKFYQYAQMATDAYNKNQWNLAISYVNEAFSTQYVDGDLYYIRGYAYESLGYYRTAKKDYKKGRKYGSSKATYALQALRQKRKLKHINY